MLPLQERDSKFLFAQTSLTINAINNDGEISFDGYRVNQGFVKLFNKIESLRSPDNKFLLIDYA